MLPSWPVFIACSMSNASAAAHLADDDAVGAHAQRVAHQVALRDLAAAFQAGGRVSRRTTCGCCNCSSAASSIVTMRSPWSISRDMAFISVVLPEPVPPEMIDVEPARAPAISSTRATGCGQRAELDQPGEIDLLAGEFADRDIRPVQRQRREHDVDAASRPSAAHPPSGSIRRCAGRSPTAMRWEMLATCAASRNRMSDSVELAAALDEHAVRAVDHDVGDGVVVEQRLSGPSPSMSSTSSPASWRCSRRVELEAPLGGDLRQHALDLSSVERGRGGMLAMAAGSSCARHGHPQRRRRRGPAGRGAGGRRRRLSAGADRPPGAAERPASARRRPNCAASSRAGRS